MSVITEVRKAGRRQVLLTMIILSSLALAILIIVLITNNNVTDLITSYHRQTAATLKTDHSSTANQLSTYNKQLTQARQDLGAAERTDTELRAQVAALEAEVRALGGKPRVVMVPEPVIVTKPLPEPAPTTTTVPPTSTTTTRPRPRPTTPPTTTTIPCMVTTPSIPGVPEVPHCLAQGGN